MADIQFNEPQYTATPVRKPSGLARLAIRLGLASDETSAQKVLLVALVLIVLATIAVLIGGAFSTAPVPLPPTL